MLNSHATETLCLHEFQSEMVQLVIVHGLWYRGRFLWMHFHCLVVLLLSQDLILSTG